MRLGWCNNPILDDQIPFSSYPALSVTVLLYRRLVRTLHFSFLKCSTMQLEVHLLIAWRSN
eukprot:4558652-Pleurochrysis_carterae.AAC.1